MSYDKKCRMVYVKMLTMKYGILESIKETYCGIDFDNLNEGDFLNEETYRRMGNKIKQLVIVADNAENFVKDNLTEDFNKQEEYELQKKIIENMANKCKALQFLNRKIDELFKDYSIIINQIELMTKKEGMSFKITRFSFDPNTQKSTLL